MSGKLFFLLNVEEGVSLRKVVLDRKVQEAMQEKFTTLRTSYRKEDTDIIDFEGGYKTGKNELFGVDYKLDKDMRNYLDNPDSAPEFTFSSDEVKRTFASLYVTYDGGDDDRLVICAQIINRNAFLSRSRWFMFRSSKLMESEESGVQLPSAIAGLYIDGRLYFRVFNSARRIFTDLETMHEDANREELSSFVLSQHFVLEHVNEGEAISDAKMGYLESHINTHHRKAIKRITENGVLELTTEELVSVAGRVGYQIKTDDDCIILPKSKAELKELIAFLDERVYKEAFSQRVVLTNSRRPI